MPFCSEILAIGGNLVISLFFLEPNLLTHTTHSISRNKTDSARRREVLYSRIDDLHECTAPVLACVRTQHLLPPNHEVRKIILFMNLSRTIYIMFSLQIFANAVKRGVISRPPTDLLESVTDKENGSRQWVKSRAGFVPPRLFQPYMDETKVCISVCAWCSCS